MKRNAWINTRVSDEESAAWRRAAGSSRVSAWVREVANRAAGGQSAPTPGDPAGRPAPQPGKLGDEAPASWRDEDTGERVTAADLRREAEEAAETARREADEAAAEVAGTLEQIAALPPSEIAPAVWIFGVEVLDARVKARVRSAQETAAGGAEYYTPRPSDLDDLKAAEDDAEWWATTVRPDADAGAALLRDASNYRPHVVLRINEQLRFRGLELKPRGKVLIVAPVSAGAVEARKRRWREASQERAAARAQAAAVKKTVGAISRKARRRGTA